MTSNNMMNMKKAKYKTMLCRNFESLQGCSYNDKCQFAHGVTELNSFGHENFLMDSGSKGMNNFGGGFYNNQQPPQMEQQFAVKKLPNPQNYKIVKCKNFDTTGQCKYREMCTFAHGETELRTKNENTFLVGSNSGQGQGGNFMYSQQQPQMFMTPDQAYGNFNQPGYSLPQDFKPNEFNQQQFYGYYPFQGSESMMVNPSNINLNSVSPQQQQGLMGQQGFPQYQMQGNYGSGQGNLNENYMKNMQK